MSTEQELNLTYRNWRGEIADRRVHPKRVWFGSTNWHPEKQWFLKAVDLETQKERDFAMIDILSFGRQNSAVESSVDQAPEPSLKIRKDLAKAFRQVMAGCIFEGLEIVELIEALIDHAIEADKAAPKVQQISLNVEPELDSAKVLAGLRTRMHDAAKATMDAATRPTPDAPREVRFGPTIDARAEAEAQVAALDAVLTPAYEAHKAATLPTQAGDAGLVKALRQLKLHPRSSRKNAHGMVEVHPEWLADVAKAIEAVAARLSAPPAQAGEFERGLEHAAEICRHARDLKHANGVIAAAILSLKPGAGE